MCWLWYWWASFSLKTCLGSVLVSKFSWKYCQDWNSIQISIIRTSFCIPIEMCVQTRVEACRKRNRKKKLRKNTRKLQNWLVLCTGKFRWFNVVLLLLLGTHALKRHCRAHCCCCYFLSSCFFPFISLVYFVYCERRTERMIAQRPRIYICISWCLCRNTKTADSFQYVLNMRIRFALPSLLFPFRSYPTYIRSGGAHTRSARLTHP